MSDESKGAEAYSHLPTIIRDKVTAHSGPGLGPKLSSLCADLLKLNHHDFANRIKEQAKEKNDLQNQLTSIQLSINHSSRPITSAYTPPTYPRIPPAYPRSSPNPHAYTTIPPRNLNDRRPPYAAATAPAPSVHIRLATSPPPPIPTTFANTPDGIRLHDEAI
ncbi:hypothetical protein M422DRAFT_251584 [Sphaerobolus stellatus SS14]|uniref:Uncharacterized protein n=1 Tax=Sphaerobolus stellatus (strain SS14) TaxID=990650 RepID=A0A0C9W0L4_SPHS4|nr:hypothetical protein M422DRAFT_251584 [Sphaerobolus stellatus SS14]